MWGYCLSDPVILLRDTVCGTVLEEKTAKFRINFEGETYYFSASCKKKFKRNPKKFVE
jgi:YHS domain-containing protein